MTRSKELILLLKELGLSVSYSDILDVYAAWGLQEKTKVSYALMVFLRARAHLTLSTVWL